MYIYNISIAEQSGIMVSLGCSSTNDTRNRSDVGLSNGLIYGAAD